MIEAQESLENTNSYDAFSAQELFSELFWRWYKPLEKEIRGGSELRPDFEWHEPGAFKPTSLLPAHAQSLVVRQVERMAEAARQDQAHFFPGTGSAPERRSFQELSLEWLAAFEGFYTVREAQSLSAMTDATDANNDFVVLCCELGAALGHLLGGYIEGLSWVPEAPYWESYLVHRESGLLVRPFTIALRFMSTSRQASLVELIEQLSLEVKQKLEA